MEKKTRVPWKKVLVVEFHYGGVDGNLHRARRGFNITSGLSPADFLYSEYRSILRFLRSFSRSTLIGFYWYYDRKGHRDRKYSLPIPR